MGPHTAQDGSEDVAVRSVFVRMRCSQTIGLRASCRPYARISDSLARATVCVEEMPFLYLLPMPLLYLLASLLDTSLGVIPVVGTRPEFDSLWEHQSSGNDV